MERPSFQDLHNTFDQFLSNHTKDRYPYIELQVYSYDHLAPHTPEEQTIGSSAATVGMLSHNADTVLTGTDMSAGPIVQLQVSGGQWRGSTPDLRGLSLRNSEFAERLSLGCGEMPERRYVESPVNPSRTSTLSIQDDLIAHLKKRFSHTGGTPNTNSHLLGNGLHTSGCNRPQTIHTDQPQEHIFQVPASAPSPDPRQPLRVHSVCLPELQRSSKEGEGRRGEEEEEDSEKGYLRVVFRETDV